MAATLKHITLFGASGNIGSFIAQAFIKHKEKFASIKAVTSNPDDPKYKDLSAQGLQLVKANYSDVSSLTTALQGTDIVVSATGGHGTEQIQFIDAAIAAGVKLFVPSQFGLDNSSPELKNLPLLVNKNKIQQHLEANKEKIHHINISTGGFADWYIGPGAILSEIDLQKKTFTMFGTGNEIASFTDRSDIGEFVVAVVLKSNLSESKTVRVKGFNTTRREVFNAIKAKGIELTEVPRSIDDCYKEAQEAFKGGDLAKGGIETIKGIYYSGAAQIDKYHKEDTADYPEVKPKTLQDVINALY